MRCREVRERLVAWQDAELSPGETVQVREHLASCDACRAEERRLARATPRARLAVPAAVQARLEDRLDVDVILALAARPEPAKGRSDPLGRVRAFLARETRLPTAAVLAYAVLLAAALGWGISSAWTLARLDGVERVARDAPAAPTEIPAEQFAPAAYDPERTGIPAQDPPEDDAVR